MCRARQHVADGVRGGRHCALQGILRLRSEIHRRGQEEIRSAAVRIFEALGCRGLARVDFFVEHGTNRVLFNEINTIPGFTSISMYPKLLEQSGVPYPKLLDRLFKLAQEA